VKVGLPVPCRHIFGCGLGRQVVSVNVATGITLAGYLTLRWGVVVVERVETTTITCAAIHSALHLCSRHAHKHHRKRHHKALLAFAHQSPTRMTSAPSPHNPKEPEHLYRPTTVWYNLSIPHDTVASRYPRFSPLNPGTTNSQRQTHAPIDRLRDFIAR
jgi:hypothetical protein